MYGKRKAFAIGCGVLLALSVGLNFAQLGKIEALSVQIKNLEYAQIQNESKFNQIGSQLNDLSSGISSGNSLFSNSETTVAIDENKQLTATVSVIPKEIGPEDTVYISIGDLKEKALSNGTVYTATLALTPLTQYSAYFTPCVTLLSPDGTQKQETLGYVSLVDYFELYYAYDVVKDNEQVTIDVGLQSGSGNVLSLPQDIEHIRVSAEDSSAKGKSSPMVPDGERIPEASGYVSSSTSSPDTESAVVSSLYYSYYTANFDNLSEMEGEISFTCEIEIAGGLLYKIDLGTWSAEDKQEASGGGGNLYPEWEE